MQELPASQKKQTRTTMQIRIEPELREKFRARAKERGLSASIALRRLITDFVENPQERLVF